MFTRGCGASELTGSDSGFGYSGTSILEDSEISGLESSATGRAVSGLGDSSTGNS